MNNLGSKAHCVDLAGIAVFSNTDATDNEGSNTNIFHDASTNGLYVRNNSNCGLFTNTTQTKTQIISCTTGIRAERGGVVGAATTSNVIYTANGTDTIKLHE